MATKEIPLIGTGFEAYINNLFWFPPFSSSRQAFEMLTILNKDMSDVTGKWIIKREEIAVEQAPDDFRKGCEAWLEANGSSKEGCVSHAVYVPAARLR